jgi:hypothetical protein
MALTDRVVSMDIKDSSSEGSGHNSHIREVWAHNLEEEMDRIRDIAETYPYIAMVRFLLDQLVILIILGYRVPRGCCASCWSVSRWS